VAHSTGCKLLTEALREIAPEQRPQFVHLCAPALTEKEVEYDLPNMAQKQTSVYYCKEFNFSLGNFFLITFITLHGHFSIFMPTIVIITRCINSPTRFDIKCCVHCILGWRSDRV